MVDELTKVTKLEDGDVVEIDGEKRVVGKDEYGFYFKDYEQSERERFLSYLDNHEQVNHWYGPMEIDNDINIAQSERVNVIYEFAEDTGWKNYSDLTLELHDFDGVELLYFEKRNAPDGDVWAQIAIPE